MDSRRLMAAAAVAVLLIAGLAPVAAASSRGLHVTKECSDYTGAAGSYCTFTSSNIGVINRGDRIYYEEPATNAGIDTDVEIVSPQGVVATGHCTLIFATLPGTCSFEGELGRFGQFEATVSVSVDGSGLWHWAGDYVWNPRG